MKSFITKKGLTLIAALLLVMSIKAQSAKIIGAILGEGEERIAGATVMLIGAQDSILKSYAITDKIGGFSISGIKEGDYVLKASFFGFLPYEKQFTFVPDDGDLNLGSIQLQPKMLDKVMVDGEYIPIQMKGDTIEYDARAFETNEHDNVEALLQQLPGVEVSDDGTIKVQGKEVTKILVDGEEFFGDDPKIATKNLPAKAVEKVQVFDKKSDMAEFTGVDDGSESPTINLKLKESHKKGMFGNIEAGIGVDAPYQDLLRYQSKLNVHYFKKKFQFSVIGMSNNVNETGFSFGDYIDFMGGIQNLSMGSGGSGFRNSGLATSSGGSNDGFLNTTATGLNMNYKPTKKTTLTGSVFLNEFNKTYQKNLDRLTYYTDSTLATTENLDQRSQTLNNRGNLKLEQKFDSTHFLNVTLSGSWDKANYTNASTRENFNSSEEILSGFVTDLNQQDFKYDFSAATSYRKKFKKAGRFTGGGFDLDGTNNNTATTLSYLNSLYLMGIPTDYYTDQSQLTGLITNNLGANWMWSEPLSDNQLLQVEYAYSQQTESRNKAVYDIVAAEEQFNDFLSADGRYRTFAHDVELKHKFLSDGFNTTVAADYKYLTLTGDSIFAAPKQFQYILPSARMDWDVKKTGNIRLSYSTSVTEPTLNQLQALPNNTNPSEITLGNTNLSPEYKHSAELRFRNFNQFNFTFIMASISANYTQNNIAYSQNINAFLVKEIMPQNLGDEKGINAFITYGTTLYPIQTKFSISSSGSISNGAVNLNGVGDRYTSYLIQPNITVENINKKILNLRAGFGYTYSVNQYRDNDAFNNDFSNWNYNAKGTVKIKTRWEISAGANHYFYPNFETNNQLLLIDAGLALNLLESRKLQVYLTGKDLLNQNTGISQYYQQNIYEQEITQTLARYFMLGVKYSFQRLGAVK